MGSEEAYEGKDDVTCISSLYVVCIKNNTKCHKQILYP